MSREKIRVVLTVDDYGTPGVVAALSQGSWELMDDREWEDYKQGAIDAAGIARRDYSDVVEAWVTVDYEALKRAARVHELNGEVES